MYRDIKRIREVADIDEVNQLLAEGWMLIEFYKPSTRVVFVLGTTSCQDK